MLRLLLIVFVLTGCATAPQEPSSIKLPKDARVGIYVDIPDSIVHRHIGTTVLNNFDKEYQLGPDFVVGVTNLIESEIKAEGFVPVVISRASAGALGRAPSVSGQTQGIKSEGQQSARALIDAARDDMKLSGLIMVLGSSSRAAIECTGGPCLERTMPKSGLYSRSFVGLHRYFAVTAVSINVFAFVPNTTDLAGTGRLSQLRDMRTVVALHGFDDPKDHKQLTQAELNPVIATIRQYFVALSVFAAETLAGK
jgi:hypothetical protein